MAITQKKVKEEIKRIEKSIIETVEERDELLSTLKELRDKSTDIELSANEEIMRKIDDYNGLTQTLKYFNGYLDSLNWTLEEMKAKK